MDMMNVNEVMTASVATCSPTDPLQTVAERMDALDVGAIPVAENGQVIGMVTDRDIVIRAVAKGEDVKSCKVGDVMTPDVVFCSPDDTALDAARLMASRQVRRLVVLDDQKQLCGILTLGDLALEGEDDKLMGRVLEHISEPPATPSGM
jgi:CBS domain-containing protein